MNFAVPEWPMAAQALPNDAVVHLAQTAEAAGWPLTLLFLHEAPALRQQLNANGLLRLPWWNVFDQIQGIELTEGLPLDVSDVPLPAGSDLIYNGSDVLIMQENRLLGTVTRHQGAVWQVSWQLAAGGRRVDQYDDRGLVTTQTWYTAEGQMTRKEWLGLTGQWIMRQTDQVAIAPSAQARFAQASYPDAASVVGEFLQRYLLAQTAPVSLVMMATAAAAGWQEIIPPSIATHYLVTAGQDQLLADLSGTAASFITETAADARHIQAQADTAAVENKPVVRVIPPFSTHLNLGRSNETAASIIYWHVNRLTTEERNTVFRQLLDQLQQEPDNQLIVNADADEQNDEFQQTAVCFAAKQQDIDLDSAEFSRLQAVLSGEEPPAATPVEAKTEMTEADEQAAVAGGQEPENDDSAAVLAVQRFLARITYQTKAVYDQVSQDFATARLLVDLGQAPDLYMQIAAISAGIPQINRHQTGYVLAGQNGQIIDRLSELPAALAFYLNSLRHWNEALVVNARLIDQYSDDHSQALWQEVLVHG